MKLYAKSIVKFKVYETSLVRMAPVDLEQLGTPSDDGYYTLIFWEFCKITGKYFFWGEPLTKGEIIIIRE